MPPITKLRSLQINPGNLWVGDGDPDTTMAGGDVHIEGTLEVDGSLNLDGAIAFGNTLTVGEDDTGYDVTFYGATSGSYMMWDEDVDSLLVIGDAAKFRLGTFNASSAGYGSALSATNSAAFRVYADDGGAAIGSGTLARAGEFRHLQTYTSGNREQESAGVVGKIVSVAGTNRHNMCGVLGSYETKTSLTVGGQAATTDTWCQAAIIGRVGGASITIDTNGVLAGVAAMSNVATALAANNGIYPAFYAGKWSGTETWSHGLYIQANAVDKGIQIGELSSTTEGSGVTLSASVTRVLEVHADDNDTARAVGTQGRAIFGRTMIYANNACEDWGVDGLSKVSAVAKTGNVSAGVVGRFESTGTCSTATGSGNCFVAGVMGRLGLAANMTLGAGTFACGVLSFYNTASASDPTGEYTCAFMATASDIAGTGDWDYGVYIEDSAKVWYSTNTISGSTATNSFDIEVTDTQTNSSGYSRGLYVNVTSTGDKTSTGEVNAVGIDLTPTGDSYIATPVSIYTGECGDATISNLWGIYMYMDDIGGSATVTTKYGMNIGIDNGDDATTCAYFRLYNHGSASNDVDYVFDFPNAGISAAQYFFHAGTTGTMIEAGDITSGKSCTNGLRIKVGATVRVIPLYED